MARQLFPASGRKREFKHIEYHGEGDNEKRLRLYLSKHETPNIYVYFDNLQVTHLKGALLQEEGHYPFGLEMKGISSQAAIKMQTRYKFNAGSELEDNFDINYYETSFRQYDAQIGRFTSVDMLAANYVAMTPYQFGGNNPISINDPTGPELDSSRFEGRYNDFIQQAPGFFSGLGYGDWRREMRSAGLSSEQITTAFADGALWGNSTSHVEMYGFAGLSGKHGGGNADDDQISFHGEDAQKFVEVLSSIYGEGSGENEPGGKWDSWGVGFVAYHGDAIGGTNFIGPGSDDDPRSLGLKPIDEIDLAAYHHDISYYKKGAGGVAGAVFNKGVL